MKYIILTDDDIDDCELFRDAVKELSIQTKLSILGNGAALMATLEETVPPPPDVIFLDLNMPLKNGYESLIEIRNTPKLKGIPIVIFSTTASDDAVNRTYEHGANYYICKPASFSLLVKVIETVLALEIWQTPQTSREKYLLEIA
jgi:DNA-binding NarL/FixJ family response regulator